MGKQWLLQVQVALWNMNYFPLDFNKKPDLSYISKAQQIKQSPLLKKAWSGSSHYLNVFLCPSRMILLEPQLSEGRMAPLHRMVMMADGRRPFQYLILVLVKRPGRSFFKGSVCLTPTSAELHPAACEMWCWPVSELGQQAGDLVPSCRSTEACSYRGISQHA